MTSALFWPFLDPTVSTFTQLLCSNYIGVSISGDFETPPLPLGADVICERSLTSQFCHHFIVTFSSLYDECSYIGAKDDYHITFKKLKTKILNYVFLEPFYSSSYKNRADWSAVRNVINCNDLIYLRLNCYVMITIVITIVYFLETAM